MEYFPFFASFVMNPCVAVQDFSHEKCSQLQKKTYKNGFHQQILKNFYKALFLTDGEPETQAGTSLSHPARYWKLGFCCGSTLLSWLFRTIRNKLCETFRNGFMDHIGSFLRQEGNTPSKTAPWEAEGRREAKSRAWGSVKTNLPL